MDDAVLETHPTPELLSRRGHVLTLKRVAVVIVLALLAVTFRRRLRFAREVFRHRRRLKLAFTVLMLLRHLRKA